MKLIKKLIPIVIVSVIAGCAAGVNFKKMEENQLVLGNTTKGQIVSTMGKANGKGTNTFNGIELEILNYAFAKAGAGGAAFPGLTPARSQGFLFRDGILVGKEYTSSFAVDSTYFDVSKAKTIVKGQLRAEVVQLMGEPRGEYIYPLVEDKQGYAYVYMFTQTKGFKSKSDVLVVEFDADHVVTSTKLTSDGQL